MAALSRQAQEAERLLLGAAILDPVVLGVGVDPADWLIPWHAECWARLGALRAEPLPAGLDGSAWTEAVLLAAWEWSDGVRLEAHAVAALPRECPSPLGAAYALGVVRRCAKARRLYDACASAMEGVAHGDDLGEVACGLLPAVVPLVPPPRVEDFGNSLPVPHSPMPLAAAWARLLPAGTP